MITIKDQVLELMKDGLPRTAAQIHEEAGTSGYTSAWKAVTKLIDDGLVKDTGRSTRQGCCGARLYQLASAMPPDASGTNPFLWRSYQSWSPEPASPHSISLA